MIKELRLKQNLFSPSAIVIFNELGVIADLKSEIDLIVSYRIFKPRYFSFIAFIEFVEPLEEAQLV